MSTLSVAFVNVSPIAQLPEAAKGIKQLPLDILAIIASFLPTTERLGTMRRVCKEWSNLPFDGGDLDLSKMSHLSDQDLRNILDAVEKRGDTITSLNLKSCYSITDAALADLAKLPLTSLNLAGTYITDGGLAHNLAKLPLTSLNLAGTHITDAGLVHLAKLPLTSLNLAGCKITDAGLVHLAKLLLTSLDLAVCINITDVGLAHLAKLPLLTSLDLVGCRNIIDAGLAHLSKLPIRSLYLAGCRNITDVGVAHLAALPLTSLILVACSNITDAGVAHLAKLPLRSLDLSRCGITDGGLAHLAELSLLTSLDLTNCENITDAGLAHLAKLPLTSLDLGRCREITSAGARAFKAGLIPSVLTDVRLRGKIDHYVYVLASQPKGGDRWGEIHRYEDHNRLRLAQAIAAQTLSESFKDSWLEKSLNVIEIIDLTGSSVLNDAQRARIDVLLGEIPANIRSDVDDQVYALTPGPKGGENWGQLHRYDDLSRLKMAVIKALENSLFTMFPIKSKTGLKILGKG